MYFKNVTLPTGLNVFKAMRKKQRLNITTFPFSGKFSAIYKKLCDFNTFLTFDNPALNKEPAESKNCV